MSRKGIGNWRQQVRVDKLERKALQVSLLVTSVTGVVRPSLLAASPTIEAWAKGRKSF